ncbi:hypothetical protein DFJ73DRAFT_831276 [Zopfochytrium polystomum]|nr:hypothetical protein DFJ73DRAFT_831276 [Zopfochytrium polystomum]
MLATWRGTATRTTAAARTLLWTLTRRPPPPTRRRPQRARRAWGVRMSCVRWAAMARCGKCPWCCEESLRTTSSWSDWRRRSTVRWVEVVGLACSVFFCFLFFFPPVVLPSFHMALYFIIIIADVSLVVCRRRRRSSLFPCWIAIVVSVKIGLLSVSI